MTNKPYQKCSLGCLCEQEEDSVNAPPSTASLAARLVEPPLEQEVWFQNLIVGVRGLVQNQASRRSRQHLLASIDEAARRLQAGRLVEPPLEMHEESLARGGTVGVQHDSLTATTERG